MSVRTTHAERTDMNLTPEQKATIDELNLEVVECDMIFSGNFFVGTSGAIYKYKKGPPEKLYLGNVVVRPAAQKRIAELEAELEAARNEVKMLRHKNQTFEPLIEKCEAELAPTRALKVGSTEWAMYQIAIGNTVLPAGTTSKWMASGWRTCEPFTLYTAPKPQPTAEELVAAIEAIEHSWKVEWGRSHGRRIADAMDLAVRYRKGVSK